MLSFKDCKQLPAISIITSAKLSHTVLLNQFIDMSPPCIFNIWIQYIRIKILNILLSLSKYNPFSTT